MNIFSRINKLSDFGSKFIKMSPESNSVSGLLHSVRSMAEGRGRMRGTRVSGRRSSEHLLQRESNNLEGESYLGTDILETSHPSSVVDSILAFSDSS